MKLISSMLIPACGLLAGAFSAYGDVLMGFDFSDAATITEMDLTVSQLATHGPLPTNSPLLGGGDASSFTHSNLQTASLSLGTGLQPFSLSWSGDWQNFSGTPINSGVANAAKTEAAAVAAGLYVEFTLEANPGFAFSIDATNSLQFTMLTWKPEHSLFVRSSLDGYTNTLGGKFPILADSFDVGNFQLSIDLDNSTLTNLEGPVTFRLYMMTGTSGDERWDNMIFHSGDGPGFDEGFDFYINGSTYAVPEPSTFALIGGALILALVGFRRRVRM